MKNNIVKALNFDVVVNSFTTKHNNSKIALF